MSARGFTLLEMVLALAVFALLGLLANRVLYQSMRLERSSAQHAGRLAQIQHALAIMERDFSAAIPRPSRTPGALGGASPQAADGRNGSDAIAFTHTGWPNPGGVLPRSMLQRVGYRIDNGSLVRDFLDYPDMPAGSDAHRRRLLKDVSELRLRYWSQGAWRESWQDDGAMPQAIEVRLSLKEGRTVTRRFLLAEGE
jgi:general secretion pathway protein J